MVIIEAYCAGKSLKHNSTILLISFRKPPGWLLQQMEILSTAVPSPNPI